MRKKKGMSLDIGDIIRLTQIRTHQVSPVLLPSENMSCNNAVSRLPPDCSCSPGTLPSEWDRVSPLRPAPRVSWAACAPLTSGDGKAWARCLGPDLECWYRKVILNEEITAATLLQTSSHQSWRSRYSAHLSHQDKMSDQDRKIYILFVWWSKVTEREPGFLGDWKC